MHYVDPGGQSGHRIRGFFSRQQPVPDIKRHADAI
jgi:hypothetical protein